VADGWLPERARLEALARAIEPSVRLEVKRGWRWRALARGAALATLGGISARGARARARLGARGVMGGGGA
jgi:hypothetical protein